MLTKVDMATVIPHEEISVPLSVLFHLTEEVEQLKKSQEQLNEGLSRLLAIMRSSGHRDPIRSPDTWLPAKEVLLYPGLDHLKEEKLLRLHKALLEDDFRHLYFRKPEDDQRLPGDPIQWNLPVVYDWYHSDRSTHRLNLIQRQNAQTKSAKANRKRQ